MKREFNVKVSLDERYVDDFCSFLKNLEYASKSKEDRTIGMMVYGSKGFEASFGIDTEYHEIQVLNEGYKEPAADPQTIFDNGGE